jgi:hypothetical protein
VLDGVTVEGEELDEDEVTDVDNSVVVVVGTAATRVARDGVVP